MHFGVEDEVLGPFAAGIFLVSLAGFIALAVSLLWLPFAGTRRWAAALGVLWSGVVAVVAALFGLRDISDGPPIVVHVTRGYAPALTVALVLAGALATRWMLVRRKRLPSSIDPTDHLPRA